MDSSQEVTKEEEIEESSDSDVKRPLAPRVRRDLFDRLFVYRPQKEKSIKKIKAGAAKIPDLDLHKSFKLELDKEEDQLIVDPFEETIYNPGPAEWTEEENRIFTEKYVRYPKKNFAKIQSYLANKTIKDCIQHYYLTKAKTNYKKLVLESGCRVLRGSTSATTKVRSKKVIKKAAPLGIKKAKNVKRKSSQSLNQKRKNSVQIAAQLKCTTLQKTNIRQSPPDEMKPNNVPLPSLLRASGYSNEYEFYEPPTIKYTKTRNGLRQKCLDCKTDVKTFSTSRPVRNSEAWKYGILQSEVNFESRVCLNCFTSIKYCLKKRQQCLSLTCPNLTNNSDTLISVKWFPSIWAELMKETRLVIRALLRFPPDATKCCTACFDRICESAEELDPVFKAYRSMVNNERPSSSP